VRVLFVTPIEHGSGEIITSRHMAEGVERAGGAVHFLASPFAHKLVAGRFPDAAQELPSDAAGSRRVWRSTLNSFRPDAVVFADYPLLFFQTGVSPLVREPGWADELEQADACLITLDHTGFAQAPIEMFFGPPHLSLHYETLPAIPERMRILLPCPMNDPRPNPSRNGLPFRYWDVPLNIPGDLKARIRRRFLSDGRDLLIFHSVPGWAWRAAHIYGLPYFSFLPQILEYHLGALASRTVVVSVNNGSLLPERTDAKLRIVNLPILPVPEYESLMFASDLMITDNKISISLGKAVCGLQPCAAFKNRYTLRELLTRLGDPLREAILSMESLKLGSIFPYEVFPSGMTEELQELGLYRGNSLTNAFVELEIFDDEETGEKLRALLTQHESRMALREEQRRYLSELGLLPETAHALQQVLSDAPNRK